MAFLSLFAKFQTALKDGGTIAHVTAKFTGCQTDCERVALVFELEQFQKVFCSGLIAQSKSDTRATDFKERGNSYYKRKDLTRALQAYTEGIFAAKVHTQSESIISFLFANRSAVLYHLREYELCCRDVEEAVKHGYPNRLLFKLHERKAKCYFDTCDMERAKESFEKSLHALNFTVLDKKDKNDQAREILKQIQICHSSKGRETKVFPSKRSKLVPSIPLDSRNDIYVSASKAFELQYTNEKGRFAVAATDIYPGDVVLIDKPFAKVLLPNFRLSHCFHCLERCKALLPCKSCPNVGFCSYKCQKASAKEYHDLDCCIYGLVLQANLGLGYLALRTVFVAGLSTVIQYMDCPSSTNSDALSSGLNKEGLYDPLSYSSIHSLIGNCDKRSVADLFERAVKAAYLLFLVKSTTFLKSNTSKDDQYKVGGNLLKQLQMLPCNAHEISELRHNGSFTQAESVEIGSAIYGTLSLLNHSCDPSVVRHNYGGDCVLRAIKVIKKGEEIIDNYGTLYAVSTRRERAELLQSQYYFTCSCIACIDDWPLYGDISSKEPIFKCRLCGKGTSTVLTRASHCFCEQCNIEADYSLEMKEFYCARESFLQGKAVVFSDGHAGSHIPAFLNYLCAVCKYIQLPWQEFNDCQEVVKQCFSMLGNCYFVSNSPQ